MQGVVDAAVVLNVPLSEQGVLLESVECRENVAELQNCSPEPYELLLCLLGENTLSDRVDLQEFIHQRCVSTVPFPSAVSIAVIVLIIGAH